MMSSGFARELQRRAIMKATSRPLHTSKSNLVQLLCKSQHRPRPASRGLWEMLPKRQRRAALADKRLPLGGWTLLLMLLNAEQTRGLLFWDAFPGERRRLGLESRAKLAAGSGPGSSMEAIWLILGDESPNSSSE